MQFNNKKSTTMIKILLLLVIILPASMQSQFQFLYKKKELSPTGLMGIGMGYYTIDNDGFPAGFRGDIRARLMHRITTKFSYYRSNSMKSNYGNLDGSTNLQFETCFLFKKLEQDGVSLGLYAAYDQGIRNTKYANVVLENAQTGKQVGNSGNIDANNRYGSDIKILYRTKLPAIRTGISFYNLTKSRYEQYYLCYTFLASTPQGLLTTDVSAHNLTIPIRYNMDGLAYTKHGFILGYNTLLANIFIMDIEVGFRPSFYQTHPKEEITKVQRGLFFQLSAGIRIF
jgi:hypothetical protein